MTNQLLAKSVGAFLCGVSAVALSVGYAAAQSAAEARIAEIEATGTLLAGDKHNHTTCTDGSTSVNVLVNESIVTYELDWFAQTGHGGEGVRDCRFSDPEYDGAGSGEGDFWENTIGTEAIGGDEETTSGFGAGNFFGRSAREMWRWQSLTEYAFPATAAAGQTADEPVWLGIETNVPGHEHASMAIIDRQFRTRGDAYATGQFEYLWDRSDDDTSGGDENDFENPENNGVPKQVDVIAGFEGHERSVASVEWIREFHRARSYYVPAHVERQGGFDTDGTRGYNVEHFRDYHNAGLFNPANPRSLSVAMGAEFIAGHQSPRGGRGTYEADRPTAGLGTYGGAGAYGAAEVTVPGTDPGDTAAFLAGAAEFDQTTPLTLERLTEIQGELNDLFDGRVTEPSGSDLYDSLTLGPAEDGEFERYVFAQPGVRTMWDAMLAEGRKFWIFGSSDWHNRGEFGPFEPQSTLDFYPGEYQKIKVHTTLGAEEVGFNNRSAARIISAMQRGNHYSVMGDLVDEFYFVMCQGNTCAEMGQTLRVSARGPDVEFMIKMRDPEGVNNSPYSFPNPSLAQIGIDIPVNAPKVAVMDIIRGDVTGVISPDDPAYTSSVSNPTTEIFASFDNGVAGGETEFTVDGEFLIASGTIPASDFTNDMYFRVRATNMPKGTPNETDANGNPLLDDFSALIPCFGPTAEIASITPVPNNSSFNARNQVLGAFDGSVCPDHLPTDSMGIKFVDADVEAWSDLWLYANPIFIDARR